MTEIASDAMYATLAVAVILWSTVDERVALSFGLAILSINTSNFINLAMIFSLTGDWFWVLQTWGILMVLSIVAVVATAVGATVAVRRARL